MKNKKSYFTGDEGWIGLQNIMSKEGNVHDTLKNAKKLNFGKNEHLFILLQRCMHFVYICMFL